MAIRLNNLKQDTIEKTDINFIPVYSDLHLDLKLNYTTHNQLYKQLERKDLVVNYNAEAIQNSLYNIFNTMPGQKLLNPDFGLNLKQFLFSPLDNFTATNIAETILVNLRLYEPRINVTNINVYPDKDEYQYIIDIYYNIPDFDDNKTFNFHYNLNENS